jgi:hypothetical protein
MDYRSRLRRLFLEAIVLMLGATIFFLAAVAPRGGIDTTTVVNSANQDEEACEQEYQTVQTALHYYMSTYNVAAVPAAEATNDMASPIQLSIVVGIPRTTIWAYTWDSKGRVTTISQIGSGPWVPAGCVVSG